MTAKEKSERDKLEKQYKDTLKEFAIQYVALWNALQSLGLNDRQTKGAIEQIFLSSSENKEVKNEVKV